MALETLLTVILILVGMGVIVIGVLLLQARPEVQKEVVVQEPPTWTWAGGWLPTYGGWGWPNGAPYYSHVPLRPIVY